MRLALLVVAMLAAACGGGDVSEEEVDIPDATAACAQAFAQAVEPGVDATTPTGGDDLDTATLSGLAPTLGSCEDADDWFAGARAHPDALPRQMDRVTALRLLCDADDGDVGPCRQMETPSETDDLG